MITLILKRTMAIGYLTLITPGVSVADVGETVVVWCRWRAAEADGTVGSRDR